MGWIRRAVFLLALLPAATAAGQEGQVVLPPSPEETAPENDGEATTFLKDESVSDAPPDRDLGIDWKTLVNPMAGDRSAVDRGRVIYMNKGMCHACHGEKGDGDGGQVAFQFTPLPNAFFSPEWHDSLNDGELMGILQEGKSGTGMVPFVPDFITEEEGWAVINYIRTLRGNTTDFYEQALAARAAKLRGSGPGVQAPEKAAEAGEGGDAGARREK